MLAPSAGSEKLYSAVKVISICRVGRVVATAIAGFALAMVSSIEYLIVHFLARVANKRRTETGYSHARIGTKQVFYQKAIDVLQPHIFVIDIEHIGHSRCAVDCSVGFRRQGQSIYRRISDVIAKLIYRISILVDPLDDPECSLIECRAEKSGDGRIALILAV